jgi:hypothetical protein
MPPPRPDALEIEIVVRADLTREFRVSAHGRVAAATLAAWLPDRSGG